MMTFVSVSLCKVTVDMRSLHYQNSLFYSSDLKESRDHLVEIVGMTYPNFFYILEL